MRRRFHPAVRALAWTAGVVVALVLLRAAAFWILAPRIAAEERAATEALLGPIEPVATIAEEVPPEEDLVAGVAEAIRALDLQPDEASEWPPLEDPTSWSDEVDLTPLDERLAARSGAFDRLSDALARKRSSLLSLDAGAPERHLSHLVPWLTAAKLSFFDGAFGLRRGDTDRLNRSLGNLHGLAVAARTGSLFLDSMIGLAIEGLYLELLRSALPKQTTLDQLGRWEVQLASLRALPGPEAGLLTELRLVRFWAKSPERAEDAGASSLPFWSHLLLPRHEAAFEASSLRAYRTLAELSRRPRVTWPPDAILSLIEPNPMRALLDPTHATSRVVVPMIAGSLQGYVEKLQLASTVERLAALAVGLAKEALSQGSYPDSLGGALDPAFSDRFAGDAPTQRHLPDGGVELSLGAAARLAWEISGYSPADSNQPVPATASRWPRLCSWTLPPAGELSATT